MHNSFYVMKYVIHSYSDPLDTRISCIQLKNGNIVLTYLTKDNYLISTVFEIENLEALYGIKMKYNLNEYNFFKRPKRFNFYIRLLL